MFFVGSLNSDDLRALTPFTIFETCFLKGHVLGPPHRELLYRTNRCHSRPGRSLIT